MRKHPKKIEETTIWKVYTEKITLYSARYIWIKEIHENAIIQLKAVRDTFPNYTLHDETHVLNVIAAMDGILGDKVHELSIGELELLILAASLHDIGMVYSNDEKNHAFTDEKKSVDFLREYYPELIGCPYTEWPNNTKQSYLRTLHPFRIQEALNNEIWIKLFSKRPSEIVPFQCIISVCQAHGETPYAIMNNPNLKFLRGREVDALFCVLLLRLADLLDFDDTRAPEILFEYTANSEKSIEEWKKHMSSVGFNYPSSPTTNDLPYVAECTDPNIEHAVRDFLDRIDVELNNCIKMQKSCERNWQRDFPFPRAISREEITSKGYKSGDFRLTMDQTKILQLFAGENLYKRNDIFVRELLQNAVDATLLREKLDPIFNIDDGRIDLWEWNDSKGNIWFRIDDYGTGMTLGMLQRYFLKVGNSYYTSKELIRDLKEHGIEEEYLGISRFGIGFLSCFLCGDYADISTLYFDETKNRKESDTSYCIGSRYGLRMEITGLNGYYTLRYEAEKNSDGLPMPSHPLMPDNNIYRSTPGTSIVVRLDPGKLGFVNLKETAEYFICGTRMPIYFNGERIGYTYSEIMSNANKLPNKTFFELPPVDKEKFDKLFPKIKGQYPKIVTKTIPLDMDKFQVSPGISGIITKHEVLFDRPPLWQIKDQLYTVETQIIDDIVALSVVNAKEHATQDHWWRLENDYGKTQTNALRDVLLKLPFCPSSPDQLGNVWLPFAEREDLYSVWRLCLDNEQYNTLRLCLKDTPIITINKLTKSIHRSEVDVFYHGIRAGDLNSPKLWSRNGSYAVFYLEKGFQPIIDVSHSSLIKLPLEVGIAICGILHHPDIGMSLEYGWEINTVRLPDWREVRYSQIGDWLLNSQNEYIDQLKNKFQTSQKIDEIRGLRDRISISGGSTFGYKILNRYLMGYYQDMYAMTIDYEKNQIVTFNPKEISSNSYIYDLFPPLMFCEAANEQSLHYICSANPTIRRGITADHHFIKWLVNNSAKLNKYFERQFEKIIFSLYMQDAENIMQIVNGFREQLIAFQEHHNIDLHSFKPLTKDDFWYPKY